MKGVGSVTAPSATTSMAHLGAGDAPSGGKYFIFWGFFLFWAAAPKGAMPYRIGGFCQGGYHEQPVGPNLYDQCVNCHQWKSCLQTEGSELFLIWNT